MFFSFITARKRSLGRLCFYRCLSIHSGACMVGGHVWQGHAWQGGWGCAWQGACMAEGGYVWQGECMAEGGMHDREACVVGGMHGEGHA